MFSLIIFSFFACKQQESHSNVNAGSKQTETEVMEKPTSFAAANQQIEVYDIDGLKKLLNKNDDKIHVVNFWATWCTPCIKEIPYFEQVNAEMDDVEVSLVSIDKEDIIKTRVVPFVNKRELKSDVSVVVYEKDIDLIDAVSDNWTGSIPATVIYNKHKSYFIEGDLTHDELVAEIEKFRS